ncbi:TPA: hypothetical protein ACPDS2_000945 [Pasteurella multocida]|uniref:Uncharacterized protein n=1 Tax=Pasteurella multocida TaxID=747 RepID=A0A849CFZ9_PASMD|nr:hypothetical protein [Pasteurella multocida]AFF23958.1 hypothetical protein PMCN06_0708 [Pasteurella multocida subsp. multocida str. HN06]AFI45759.1 hypothetical protein NT08PM_0623 [Pasteurella multocida subsp. multocida str. 3480]AWW54234.1 hypothetical protein DID83_06935 [Pasteurella multocida]EPE72323.1 hypothetical protein H364_05378 [Pasteurella multocida 671/90]MCH1907101.1 hypothetical protein [Pasteurella multocida]
MKEFNLEKALAGEPVRLRDGNKAFIKFRKPENCVFRPDTELVDYFINENVQAITESWSINGNIFEKQENDGDIACGKNLDLQ